MPKPTATVAAPLPKTATRAIRARTIQRAAAVRAHLLHRENLVVQAKERDDRLSHLHLAAGLGVAIGVGEDLDRLAAAQTHGRDLLRKAAAVGLETDEYRALDAVELTPEKQAEVACVAQAEGGEIMARAPAVGLVVGLVQAAGLAHPGDITASHIVRRCSGQEVKLLSNLLAFVKPGALLGDEMPHNVFRQYWPMARAASSEPSVVGSYQGWTSAARLARSEWLATLAPSSFSSTTRRESTSPSSTTSSASASVSRFDSADDNTRSSINIPVRRRRFISFSIT